MKPFNLLPLLSVLVFASCVTSPSIPFASSEFDSDAKRFSPPEGKSNLYIAWSGGSSGQVVSFDITIDGKEIGKIVPGTFYLVTINAGNHIVVVAARLNSSKATLDAEIGKNYFYEITSTSSGITAKPSLGIVLIEEMGKIMVRQNRRAQSLSE